jgi:hypothetical protein
MILSGVDKKNNLNDRITSIHVGPTHEFGSCNRTSKKYQCNSALYKDDPSDWPQKQKCTGSYKKEIKADASH